ncbi:MAG: hypothetical protein J7J94_00660 [Thaumarchaeota archaeon]|nr:hypothetical protein [Nitrososphaerota archaeon]
MRKNLLYVLLIFTVSTAVRLYPTILSGLPFSTDSWPLIKNAESFVSNSPVPLGSEVFDDYNIYWPLSQVYGAVASEILSLAPVDAMRILIPLASSFAPIVLYSFLKRLTGRVYPAFVAGLFLACGGPYGVFMAGVTKETFSSLFFMGSIYVFSALPPSAAAFAAFMILDSALIAGHHLSYIVAFAITANVFLIEIFHPRLRGSPRRRGLMLAFSGVVGLIYYLGYALPGLKTVISFSDWLSAFSFQSVMFLAMFYVVARPKPRRMPNTWIAAPLIAYAGLLLNQYVPIVPAAPRLSAAALFYAFILVSFGFLSVVGLYAVKELDLDVELYPVLLWVSAVMGLEGYAVFAANPGLSLTLAYRLANFLIPALAALASIGIHRLSLRSNGRFSRAVALLLVVFFSAALVSQSFSAVFLRENFLGYQWIYDIREYRGALWLKHFGGDAVVYGDLKVSYLLGSYFGLRVDPGAGYAFLRFGGSSGSGNLFFAYRDMAENGYLLGPYGVELPGRWLERLVGHGLIYSNAYTSVYML